MSQEGKTGGWTWGEVGWLRRVAPDESVRRGCLSGRDLGAFEKLVTEGRDFVARPVEKRLLAITAAWLGLENASLRHGADSGGEPQAGEGRHGGEDADRSEMT